MIEATMSNPIFYISIVAFFYLFGRILRQIDKIDIRQQEHETRLTVLERETGIKQ